jgi:hypothetical protein
MKRRLLYGLSLAAVMGLAATSQVRAAALSSTAFNHKYEGDTLTPPGTEYTTVTPPGGAGSIFSTDGNILTLKNTIADGGGVFITNWGSLPTNPVDNALGWTIEFRVKIGTDGEAGANGAFNLLAKDVAGTNAQGRRVGLGIFADSVILPGALGTSAAGTPLTISTPSNSDGFHVFRIAQDPASSFTNIWRDGQLIFSDLSRQANDPSSGGSSLLRMFWGDGSGASGGPTIELDYFRWDSTGAYEPVPEPNSLLLVGIGVLGVAQGWRRRRRSVVQA